MLRNRGLVLLGCVRLLLLLFASIPRVGQRGLGLVVLGDIAFFLLLQLLIENANL